MILGYLFPSLEAGVAAMQEISTSDAAPSVTRVSDARETRFSFSTRKKSRASRYVPGQQGPDEGAGAPRLELDQSACRSSATRAVPATCPARGQSSRRSSRSTAASCWARAPGELYDQKKFDTPYIRDFLLDRGAIGRRLRDCRALVEAQAAVRQRHGRGQPGLRRTRSGRLDHVPPVALLPLGGVPVLHLRVPARRRGPAGPVRQWSSRRSSRRSSTPTPPCPTTMRVGVEHAPWLEQDISPPGVHMIDGSVRRDGPGSELQSGQDRRQVASPDGASVEYGSEGAGVT